MPRNASGMVCSCLAWIAAASLACATDDGTPNAETLTGLILTPPSVSLEPSGTQQFTVAATWSDGGTTVPPVTYSATSGTVSPSGLYTAGSTAGSFRVIVQHTGGTLADTSAVTISAPPPPGPLANECASPRAGWIWCDDFDQDRLASYFEYDNAGGSFLRVAGVGNENSYGMRARFQAGQAQTSAGALHLAIGRTPQAYFRAVDAGTANYRELYWRLYVRNQPGWTGGGGDKLTRAMIFASSTSWAQAMIAHVWSGGNSGNWNWLVIDPASGTDEQGNLRTTEYNDFPNLRWLGAAQGSKPLFTGSELGQWHCVEVHARLNDAGQSNGVMELWVDGASDASRTGLNWLGTYNQYGLNAVFVENYWNAGSPVTQERYLDNFVVSSARIGC